MKQFFVFCFKFFLVTSAIGIASLLVFSFLAPLFPAADTVLHFRHYILPALVLVSIILWFMKLRKTSIMMSILSIIGMVSIMSVSYNWDAVAQPNVKADITLFQLNLLYSNKTPNAVINLIKKNNPDIITLQEVSKRNWIVVKKIAKDYPYRIICYSSGIRNVAILSRFPKWSKTSAKCLKRKGLAWLQVNVKGKPLSVASIHLKWPYPYGQERHINRLIKDFHKIPRPVLLAGDFNAAPWSYAVKRAEDATQTKVLGGLRFTYYGRYKHWLPPMILPIDHILASPDLLAKKVEKGHFVGSDHRPLIAKLHLRSLR